MKDLCGDLMLREDSRQTITSRSDLLGRIHLGEVQAGTLAKDREVEGQGL